MQMASILVYLSGTAPSLVNVHKSAGSRWYDGAMMAMESLREAIARLCGQDAVAQALRELLAPLETYDAKHDTDLVHTLHVYVQQGGNIAATAEALFLHRNSVGYRLQRIQEVRGLQLRDPEVRNQLLASLALANPSFLHGPAFFQELEPVTWRNNHEGKR